MHLGERLDEHVDLAAATQADGPGQVVADPIVKEGGRFPRQYRLCLLEDLALETPTADGTGDLSRLADGHPGAGGAGRTPPGADHGRDGDRVAAVQPRLDL